MCYTCWLSDLFALQKSKDYVSRRNVKNHPSRAAEIDLGEIELGESRRERYIKAHLTIRTHAMKTKDLHLGNFELGVQFGRLAYATERVKSLTAVWGSNSCLGLDGELTRAERMGS